VRLPDGRVTRISILLHAEFGDTHPTLGLAHIRISPEFEISPYMTSQRWSISKLWFKMSILTKNRKNHM